MAILGSTVDQTSASTADPVNRECWSEREELPEVWRPDEVEDIQVGSLMSTAPTKQVRTILDKQTLQEPR